ncbi:hypothetical protein L7F22_028027 [Adiantum nelumboides]|nr:hypothetical protein [Adiantum nelumboides]
MIFVKDSLNGVNETQVNESGMQEHLELSNFLNQFQDVFIDDILGELPPKRGDDDHLIELIPGSSLPNKPPYRVSQAQQEEIMRQVNELAPQIFSLISCVSLIEQNIRLRPPSLSFLSHSAVASPCLLANDLNELAMFPHRGSSVSDQPDPATYNPSVASTAAAAQSHSQPSASSSLTSSAMSTSISPENPTLSVNYSNLHSFQHHLERAPQQQTLQQWPYLTHYVGAAAELVNPDAGASRFNAMQAYMQPPATLISREETQHVLLAQHPSLRAASIAPQNAMSLMQMMPAHMQEQLYNKQLLRSTLMRSRMQGPGIEPRSMYDSLHQMSPANPAGEAGAAPGRFEETCTPRPRWCPTQEQIQILESIFNSGTTTPSRDMIVDIAAQLRKYGTIAEANVFYWFQNRKARAKRKLQPPAAAAGATTLHTPSPPPAVAVPCTDLDPSSTHSLAGHGQNVVSPASQEHSRQSKSRRLSLKHASASSPTSSSSPDNYQYVSSGGLTSSSPASLQQQHPSSAIVNPFAPQESTLLFPNRTATSHTSDLPARPDQSHLFVNPWPYHHLQRQPQGEATDVDVHAAMPSASYPNPLLQKHAAGASAEDTQIEAFQKLLEYPKISLSLAPPTDHQHPSSQAMNLAQARSHGVGYNAPYSAPYSDHILQATSKGIMLINPQAGALGGDQIIGAKSTSTLSSVVLPQLASRDRHSADLAAGAAELRQLQSHQLPQASVPVARPADYQAGLMRAASSSGTQSAPAALTGAEHEQLQMWEDLESCAGAPWNAPGQAGQSHHQS